MVIGDMEDVIRDVMQAAAESLHVSVISTNGMREFVFYTKAPDQAAAKFEGLRTRFDGYELQCMIQLDQDWNVYTRFIQ